MVLHEALLCVALSSAAYAQTPSPTMPSWLQMKIHHSPDCVRKGGWHDVAGALSFAGIHHIFQGCPVDGGWSHAASTDLVHWEDWGIHDGLKSIHETYEGMDSNQSPCSGFVTTTDVSDHVCAGFRQCTSSKGVTGLNPEAHTWDVPLEIRCAKNRNLTEWGEPEYLFEVYFHRAIPYDPVRPWRDDDGKWYVALATDNCNATQLENCKGQLDLWKASAFKGPWTHVGPLFNSTEHIGFCEPVGQPELVTPDYIGGLPGDPRGGKTRVVLQSGYWTGTDFWVGEQQPGWPFHPWCDKREAVGRYDYGDMFMARTLGSHDSNQVNHKGRRVLIGWAGVNNIGGGIDSFSAQSLPRDLSLSSDYELLQQFVPELQVLRKHGTHVSVAFEDATKANSVLASSFLESRQVELVATLTFNPAESKRADMFGVEVLASHITNQSTKLFVDCNDRRTHSFNCQVGVDTTTQGGFLRKGPLLPLVTNEQNETVAVSLHAIVDGPIVTAIYNNRTAVTLRALPALETDTAVRIFGLASGGHLQAWELMGIEDGKPSSKAKSDELWL